MEIPEYVWQDPATLRQPELEIDEKRKLVGILKSLEDFGFLGSLKSGVDGQSQSGKLARFEAKSKRVFRLEDYRNCEPGVYGPHMYFDGLNGERKPSEIDYFVRGHYGEMNKCPAFLVANFVRSQGTLKSGEAGSYSLFRLNL